jgi:hypothetical protein
MSTIRHYLNDDDQEQFVQDEMRLLVSDAGCTPIDAIISATHSMP